MRPRTPAYQRLLLLTVVADLAVGVLAYAGAFHLRVWVPIPYTQDMLPLARWFEVDHHFAMLLLGQVAALYFFGFYDVTALTGRRPPLARLPVACALQALALVAVYFFRGDPMFPRSVLALYWLLDTLLLAAMRVVIRREAAGEAPRRVVLIGAAADVARSLEGLQRVTRTARYEITGWIATEDKLGDATGPFPCLGSVAELLDGRLLLDADDVFLISEETWKDRLLDVLNHPPHTERELAIMPSRYEIAAGRLGRLRVGDIPLNEVTKRPEADLRFMLKATLDRLAALAAVLVLSPLLVGLAILVRVTSGRPVIYRQARIGRGGRPFTVRKFRTMIRDAEPDGTARLASADDTRTTRVGRWLRATRLDELPQLLNVVDGTMSLVGPRPERPEFVERFLAEIPGYAERFRVKPGLTGLAQVHGEYDTGAAHKLKYDLAYIYHYSFWLDVKILFETVKVVLTRRGV